MELTVPYNVTLSVGVLGSCTVTGTANASSAATDSIGVRRGGRMIPARKLRCGRHVDAVAERLIV